MPNKAFKSLIEIINTSIYILNENGFEIYDDENPEFYIAKIEYIPEDDQLVFRTRS